jgi:predicted nucleotidyltransferase
VDTKGLRDVLEADPRVTYALLFGSSVRGTTHDGSDVDVAIGLPPGTVMPVAALGTLIADLERAAGRPVDVVLLDEAPPALAYRVFRDGIMLFERDHAVMANRKARAILEYLDFRPLEAIAIRGALAAASRGR